VHDVKALIGVVFAGLSPLVIEDVVDEGGWIRVRARTGGGPVPCPVCGAQATRVHAYHERMVADVPVDARRVSVLARIRRLVCPTARAASKATAHLSPHAGWPDSCSLTPTTCPTSSDACATS
jgi:hypothetical protein